jgi:hypothetical protein
LEFCTFSAGKLNTESAKDGIVNTDSGEDSLYPNIGISHYSNTGNSGIGISHYSNTGNSHHWNIRILEKIGL